MNCVDAHLHYWRLARVTARGSRAASINQYVAHVFACFGAGRVMWGSDWPVVTTRPSYQHWFELALALGPGVSAEATDNAELRSARLPTLAPMPVIGT